MNLTFEVPMQYCFLQHQTLLLSAVTFTTGYVFVLCFFCFSSISSFFLELFLHWSQVAYWAPTDLGISSFSILSFCHFILFIGFSMQEYWNGLPFPSPVDHILSVPRSKSKEFKDLYSKNYKTLMKEIEHDTNKRNDVIVLIYWKNSCC